MKRGRARGKGLEGNLPNRVSTWNLRKRRERFCLDLRLSTFGVSVCMYVSLLYYSPAVKFLPVQYNAHLPLVIVEGDFIPVLAWCQWLLLK